MIKNEIKLGAVPSNYLSEPSEVCRECPFVRNQFAFLKGKITNNRIKNIDFIACDESELSLQEKLAQATDRKKFRQLHACFSEAETSIQAPTEELYQLVWVNISDILYDCPFGFKRSVGGKLKLLSGFSKPI